MDETQTDHLKAYGITYHVLKEGFEGEWLLNYRGGSFLLPDLPDVRKYCERMGVRYEVLTQDEVNDIYALIERENMERIRLEKAPKIAVYIPEREGPWDDAVCLVMEYAGIPYERIYDEDILLGRLKHYDWVHLHHEDFTGQFGKFYTGYGHTKWYKEMVRADERIANRFGFKKVWELKHRVAEEIRRYVMEGGHLFAMCSAPITLDIALAAGNQDIVPPEIDGDGYTNNPLLDFSKTFAFKDFQIVFPINIYEHSDVDITREAVERGPNARFILREFSAKRDILPTILVQNHKRRIKEFLGQDTGFRRDKIKGDVIILADIPGTEEVKYVCGERGRGIFSFLGGHDPEDYQHFVGDPPTRLELHKNSPGYRLILNNILLPAARREKLKT